MTKEEAHEILLKEIERLMSLPNRSDEQTKLLEALTDFVETYEDDTYKLMEGL